jgi:hypothetical protein
MQRTLQEHIAFLEERIARLEVQAIDLNRTAAERYQSSVDLSTAQSALLYFRKAYELEQDISERNSN